MALGILEGLAKFNGLHGTDIKMRIGLNCGAVVAGVIGTSKFIYDLWGETVNLASRMESMGLPNEIQVTEAMHTALQDQYELEPRGEIQVKGAGTVNTYLLKGRGN